VGPDSYAVHLNLPTPRLRENDSDTDEGFLSTSQSDYTLLLCLETLDYWLLCGSISITTGTGLAFINNASAITHSLHGTPSLTVRLVPVALTTGWTCINEEAAAFPLAVPHLQLSDLFCGALCSNSHCPSCDMLSSLIVVRSPVSVIAGCSSQRLAGYFNSRNALQRFRLQLYLSDGFTA
jgi:hypothetical protein